MGRKSPKKNFVKENAKHHAPKPKIDDAVPKVDDGQRIVPDKPAPTSSPAPSPRGTAAFAPSSHRRFSDPFVYAAASEAPGPGAYDATSPERRGGGGVDYARGDRASPPRESPPRPPEPVPRAPEAAGAEDDDSATVASDEDSVYEAAVASEWEVTVDSRHEILGEPLSPRTASARTRYSFQEDVVVSAPTATAAAAPPPPPDAERASSAAWGTMMVCCVPAVVTGIACAAGASLLETLNLKSNAPRLRDQARPAPKPRSTSAEI